MILTEKDLLAIRAKFAVMGQHTSTMFSEAISAIRKTDLDLAKAVIVKDGLVDTLENEITTMCLTFLGLKAPKAQELRFAVAVSRLASEIERIADHATVVCREGLSSHLGPIWLKDPKFDQLANLASGMVNRALDSFLSADDQAYLTLIEDDKKVGEIQKQLNESLVSHVSKDPEKALDIIALINIVRRIERVADHAKNISIMVPYVTKGIIVRHNPEVAQDDDNDD
ncbi:MAG: phosphate signaling complex protein PhoU [Deltaproteobacteria bacterium]|jgi:phosphate transport system protein|nr:phosphate signaling complex protein PhoU [Deltaproteobacteria bacterium]